MKNVITFGNFEIRFNESETKCVMSVFDFKGDNGHTIYLDSEAFSHLVNTEKEISFRRGRYYYCFQFEKWTPGLEKVKYTRYWLHRFFSVKMSGEIAIKYKQQFRDIIGKYS